MSTPWTSTTSKIQDGQEVRASTVNPILEQHVQRDQYLYERLQQIANKSVLISYSVPIHPDEAGITNGVLNTVYYDNSTGGEGVKKTVVSFGLNSNQSYFSANDSSYCYGIVKGISATGFVDIWINGVVDLEVDIDDPTYGLIDDATGETFEVGPYFLSRKTPGKISKVPNGIAVFIGYAVSKRKFLLNPNTDEFSQLFVNYRFDILDRPTATPIFDVGDQVWTIPDSNMARLGWVDITWLQANNPSALAAYTIPAGAKFLYNIPTDFTVDNADNTGDGSLTEADKLSARDLYTLIPPHPANFVELFVNGVLQKFKDETAEDGIYSITEYGIFWFKDENLYQPWASDLDVSWEPADWPTVKGEDEFRPRIFLQFGKFNPALKDTLVSSLEIFKDVTNDSTKIVSFVDRKTGLPARTGDLLLKVTPPFGTDVTVASSATAVTNVTYDAVEGEFVRTKAPIISTLKAAPNSNIVVEVDVDGNATILDASAGSSGKFDEIEPENINLDYLGNSLHSYLRMNLPTANSNFGIVGKVLLPAGFPIGKDFYVVLHIIGLSDTVGSNRNIRFDFSYNVSSCINASLGISSAVVANSNPVTYSLKETNSTISTIDITLPNNYKAKSALVITSFVIPKANIGEESVVNFRLTRKVHPSNAYPAPIGILGTYWKI